MPRKKGDAEQIIQSSPGATTFVGDGIQIFQLLAVKHALKLEEGGMAFNTRRKLRPMWAEAFGMPKRTTYKLLHEEIDRRVRDLEISNGLNVTGLNTQGDYPA
jgi:hypothetical protein